MQKASYEIFFELTDGIVECRCGEGQLISDVAAAAGVGLNLACGSTGKCGRCAVRLIDGKFESVDGAAIQAQKQLIPACRTRICSDARIAIPQSSLLSAGEKVLIEFHDLPDWQLDSQIENKSLAMPAPSQEDSIGDIDRIARQLGSDSCNLQATVAAMDEAHKACRQSDYNVCVSIEKSCDETQRLLRCTGGTNSHRPFALAVDIGTTSVVCALVDLTDASIVDSMGGYNRQVSLCGDVASRISLAAGERALADMQMLIVEQTINRMVAALCQRNRISHKDIVRASMAGNTVMTHLLLGLDPAGLGAMPFAGVVMAPGGILASEIGLRINPGARVLLAPAVGAYVGGDISADMVVCNLDETGGNSLLIDIGTNAEMVAILPDKSLACAAPAGPAFEGQGTASGMRAAAGAIDTVRLIAGTGKVEYTIIGDAAACGICGSGYIDFIAEAFRADMLSMAGRFEDDSIAAAGYKLTEYTDSAGRTHKAWPLADGVVVTEADIASVLQAKGVIKAGMEIMLGKANTTAEKLDCVYLAGGFARCLNLTNAIEIGLLPNLPQEKFRFMGNGSLAGAFLALVDSSYRCRMVKAASLPQLLELNLEPGFQDLYAMSMLLGDF